MTRLAALSSVVASTAQFPSTSRVASSCVTASTVPGACPRYARRSLTGRLLVILATLAPYGVRPGGCFRAAPGPAAYGTLIVTYYALARRPTNSGA